MLEGQPNPGFPVNRKDTRRPQGSGLKPRSHVQEREGIWTIHAVCPSPESGCGQSRSRPHRCKGSGLRGGRIGAPTSPDRSIWHPTGRGTGWPRGVRPLMSPTPVKNTRPGCQDGLRGPMGVFGDWHGGRVSGRGGSMRSTRRSGRGRATRRGVIRAMGAEPAPWAAHDGAAAASARSGRSVARPPRKADNGWCGGVPLGAAT